MQHKNIVIIGGGPIGLTTALELAKSGICVTVLDDGGANKNQGRVLALSYASYLYLKGLEAWPDQLATPIDQVHISHKGLGISKILAKDIELTHLGYTVKYADLCNKLMQKIKDYPNQIDFHSAWVTSIESNKNYANITYQVNGSNNFLTTDLAILAEGGKIDLPEIHYRNFDYKQRAIVTTLNTEAKHNNIAYERFDKHGPLAFLPHGTNYTLVWSLPQDFATKILEDISILNDLLSSGFMRRFGKIEIIDKIYSFPLKLQVASKRIFKKMVLIGNSAQIFHPIAAQGMNLGLRDVQVLTELIKAKDKSGLQTDLFEYDKLRVWDASFLTNFTHIFARILNQPSPLMENLAGIGLMGLSNNRFLQNKIANGLIFGI